MRKFGGLIIGILVVAILVACGGDSEARPTATPTVAGSSSLPSPPAPSPTLDLSNAIGPAEAMEELLTHPNVGAVLRTVVEQDVDGLLVLADWRSHKCGIRDAIRCPEGVAQGSELPMVNVGWPVRFWVTADTLRPVLTRLLAGESLHLGFASRVPPAQARLGPIYYLGLEGPVKGEGLAVIEGYPQGLIGMFLTIDGGAGRPVLEFAWLVETWSATQHATELASVLRLEEQEIITFNP